MPSLLLLAPLALATHSSSLARTDSLSQVNAGRIADASDKMLRAAKTIQGSYTVVRGDNTASRVRFVMDRPDNVSLRSAGKIDIFTGRYHYLVSTKKEVGSDTGNYQRREGEIYGRPYVPGLSAFFDRKAESIKNVALPTYGPAQTVEVDGRVYVRRVGSDGLTVDIDPTTKLPARWSWTYGRETIRGAFEDVRFNEPIPAEAFDVTAAIQGRPQIPTPEEEALPALNIIGPGIAGTAVNGKAFDLTRLSSGKRATVVVFFDPQTQSSARGLIGLGQLAGDRSMRDVAVVGVSNSASDQITRDFLSKCRYRLTTIGVNGSADAIRAYGVKVYPTYFVLDREGTIVERRIGFDPAAIGGAVAELK